MPRYYEVRFDREKVKEYLMQWEKKGYLKVKPEKLQWTSYLLARNEIREAERIKERGKGKAKAKEKEREVGLEDGVDVNSASDMNGTSTSPVSYLEAKMHPDMQLVNGGLNGATTPKPGKRPSESPAPFTPGDGVIEQNGELEDDVGVLPVHVPKRRKLDRKNSGRQTPQGPGRRRNSVNGHDRTSVPRLGSRSGHAGTRTPTPMRRGVGEVENEMGPRQRSVWETSGQPLRSEAEMMEDDEMFAARLAKEEEQKQGRSLRSRTNENGKKDVLPPTTPRLGVSKRRRKVDDSPAYGCPVITIAPDQNGTTEAGGMGEEGLGDMDADGDMDAEGDPEPGMEFKSEDGGTPLTSMTSPSEEAVFGVPEPMEVAKMGVMVERNGVYMGPGLPVSDERSTLENEVEFGDEDAEGIDEDAEGEPDLECSI